MSTYISNTYGRNVTNDNETYNNLYREMETKVNRMPMTTGTLRKLRNEKDKVESKAVSTFAKIMDMGDTLDRQIMTVDIQTKLINIVDNEVNNTDNRALMDALEAEQRAQEDARRARMRRQQAELNAQIEASERRSSGRDRTRARSPVRDAAVPRQRAPRRSPSPVRVAVPTQPASPTEDLRNVLNAVNMRDQPEIKVFLRKEDLTCAICQDSTNLLSRHDISVLDCGHCFHFMCATKWHMDRVRNHHRRCAVCRAHQPTPPRTTGSSLNVIGQQVLDEVFGLVPPPPDLFTRQ